MEKFSLSLPLLGKFLYRMKTYFVQNKQTNKNFDELRFKMIGKQQNKGLGEMTSVRRVFPH